MTTDETRSGNGNAKAFGGIIAIVALITGIAAIVRPMQIQVEAQDAKIVRLEKTLQDHIVKAGHPEFTIQSLILLRERIDRHEADCAKLVDVELKHIERRLTKLDGL